MASIKVIKIILFLGITVCLSKRVQFFRRDYAYVQELDAFYKYHDATFSWQLAFETCKDEGAMLFYPESEDELVILKNLPNFIKNVPESNISSLYVGIHDLFHLKEFLTLDGHVTPYPMVASEDIEDTDGTANTCVILDFEGKYRRGVCNEQRAFICKAVEESPQCPTIDKDYIFKSATGKCYKVNKRLKTWTESMSTCFNEGALLLVINDNTEARIIEDLIEHSESYYMGVRRLIPNDVLYTVTGSRIDKTYHMWQDNESTNHDCGAFVKHYNSAIYTLTEDCNTKLPFVCEMNGY